MIDKKKIIAIVVFVFFGLFMFAFANPAEDDLQPINNNNNNVEKQKPVIVLGNNAKGMEVYSAIPKFTATADDGEVTITNNINANVVGTYTVTVTAKNEAGTTTETFNFVVYDTTKPVITLLGNESEIIRKGDKYLDAGATANDNYDKNITNKLVITNNLEDKKGNYTFNYNVTDNSGNAANQVVRNVTVTDADELNSSINEGKDILKDTKELKVSDELKTLLEELDKEINKGENLVDNHKTPQNDLDNEKEIIDEIIEKIKNLKFEVKYVDYEGSVIDTFVVKFMETAKIPENPTRTGYTFVGWDKVAEKVVDNMTITAEYEINYYPLTINADKGIKNVLVNNETAKETYKYNEKITIAYDLVEGYKDTTTDSVEFNMDEFGIVVNLTTDPIEYTITYNLDGGVVNGVNPTKYNVETPSFELINPTKTGYTFNGWNSDGNFGQVIAKGNTGDKTFKASWTANTDTAYTVNHYLETLDGKFELKDSDNLKGTTASTVKPQVKSYTGFNSPEVKSAIVEADGSTVVEYKYTRKEIKVTYNTTNVTNTYKYGENVDLTVTANKDQTDEYTYTFIGWSLNENDSKLDDLTAPASDVTLYPLFNNVTRKYTISFVNEDGTVLQSEDVPYGITPVYNGIIPVKQSNAQYSYRFNGWDKIVAKVTGNATYTATYTKTTNKYTIKFVNEDGTLLQSEDIKYNYTPEYNGATPTKESDAEFTYTFAGWDKPIAKVTGNATYTATYTKTTNKYTVKFVNEDGALLQSEDVKYNYTPEYKGVTPTKASTAEFTYTFAGWDKPIVKVTGNVTYKATYTKTTNKYTVKFVNEDGTLLQLEDVKYNYTPEYKGATPTKASTAEFTYTFAGWDKPIAKVTGDVTYKATYTKTTNKYTISFVNDDNKELQTLTVEYGKLPSYTNQTPTKANTAEFTYTFAGWDKPIAKVTGNATYKATYTKTTNKYTVKFVNDDNKELQTLTVEYGKFPSYTNQTPTKASTAEFTYTFAGWDKPIAKVTGNVTYKATYTKTTNKYTVKFMSDGKQIGQTQTVEYGKSAVAPTNVTKKDYTFDGWDKEFDNIKGNLVVNAKWTANQTGIRAEVKETMMLQFQKNRSYNIKDYINVYKVFADGSEKLTNDYTVSNFYTTSIGNRTLNITQGKFTDNKLIYKVISEEAYQTKFEVKSVGKSYRETSSSTCTKNCDSTSKTNSVGLDYSVIEIIEHYDEEIKVSKVKVNYTNGKSENIKLTDSVRWSHVTGSYVYNPVYIGYSSRTVKTGWFSSRPADIMDNNYIIDTVEITYNREGYGTYTVFFRYNTNTNAFTAYDEVENK